MSRDGYNGFTAEDILRSSRIQSSALRSGALERRWVCEPCGVVGDTPGQIISHLEDYSDPIDAAIWVCYRCHTILHLGEEYSESFALYRDFVGRGGSYPLARSRWAVIEDLVNPPLFNRSPPTSPRVSTVLDEIASGAFLDMAEREDVQRRLEAMRTGGAKGLLLLKTQATLF